jgi:homopolymeric O-antigen transport system permease protein
MSLTSRQNVLTLDASPPAIQTPTTEQPTGTTTSLQEEPLVVIEASSSSLAALRLRDIWIYRELLYFMVWRDLKVRYKQTALGVLWVILQPLLMTFVFTAVLGGFIRIPSEGVPYALFAFAGLTLWIFFSSAVSLTGNCLVQNANLITKVYFPRLIIPISSIIARLVDLGVSLIILGGLLIYYGVGFSFHLLMVPVVVLLISLLALAFGLWTSAVNVKYRDVGLVLPVLIQLWMFVSPIVYPLSAVPAKWRAIYSLNPLVGILDAFRSALFGTPFDWPPLLISVAVTVILLPYAAYAFQHREKTFADIV